MELNVSDSIFCKGYISPLCKYRFLLTQMLTHQKFALNLLRKKYANRNALSDLCAEIQK